MPGGSSHAGLSPEVLEPGRSVTTRRRVVEAAARVFADLGFHAATKERIGAAAGYSHQTVRDYFRTKERLLAAIVSDAWRSVVGAMNASGESDPHARLMAAYDALDTLVRSRPAEARCVLHEAQIAGPRGGPLVVDEQRAFRAAVEQLLATATGLPRSELTARAEIVIASMEALARAHVVSCDGLDASTRYTASEARASFAALTASMLQAAA